MKNLIQDFKKLLKEGLWNNSYTPTTTLAEELSEKCFQVASEYYKWRKFVDTIKDSELTTQLQERELFTKFIEEKYERR